MPPPPSSKLAAGQESLAQIEAELRAYQNASDPALHSPKVNPSASASPLSKPTSKAGLSLWEANCLTAQLAGFWGRKADGHPGPDVMGRGLLILAELVRYEGIKNPQPPHSQEGPRRPSRKPG